MFSKKLTSISIAALATLGAFAMSAETASARPGRGGGVHIGHFGGHGFGHRHFGYGTRFGIFGAPLVVGAVSYVPSCYYVRRLGVLYKVCE